MYFFICAIIDIQLITKPYALCNFFFLLLINLFGGRYVWKFLEQSLTYPNYQTFVNIIYSEFLYICTVLSMFLLLRRSGFVRGSNVYILQLYTKPTDGGNGYA